MEKGADTIDVRILVVDDGSEVADLIEIYLKSEGCAVFKCGTGTEALAMVRTQALNLAILDVMLPDISDFTLCGEVRKEHHSPVLVLTTKAEDTDKTIGLTINTDDYITEPLNLLELMARVKAQLRRCTRHNETDKAGDCRDIIDFNGLVINWATHECTLYDRESSFILIKFDIFQMLCGNRGQVISAKRLFESVWGEKYLDRNNTAMVHIRHLREKMDEPSHNPRFIKAVRGVGYEID